MATLEFLERDQSGRLGDCLAIVENESLACLEGDDIEIDGREYAVIHIHTIVNVDRARRGMVTYQVHVRENVDRRTRQ